MVATRELPKIETYLHHHIPLVEACALELDSLMQKLARTWQRVSICIIIIIIIIAILRTDLT
jgi:hypothetical protein